MSRKTLWVAAGVAVLLTALVLMARGEGPGIPCKDGTISHSAHRQGACSYHGGIKR